MIIDRDTQNAITAVIFAMVIEKAENRFQKLMEQRRVPGISSEQRELLLEQAREALAIQERAQAKLDELRQQCH